MRRFAVFLLLAGCTPEVAYYGSALCLASGPSIASPDAGAVLHEAMDTEPYDGHQSDVKVVSDLPAGEELSLSFITHAGVLLPWPEPAKVDDDGSATFEGVSFPEGRSTLQVHYAAPCGIATDERPVEVLPRLTCEMEFTPEAEDRPAYRPRETVNRRLDSVSGQEGIQLSTTIETVPGANVSVWDLNPEEGPPRRLFEGVADGQGKLHAYLDLEDGPRDLEARCSVPSPARETVSRTEELFVDSVPPGCFLQGVAEGQAVTTSEDLDAVLEGTQIEVEAVVTGDDASRSPISFQVRAGLARFTVTGSPLLDGKSAATVMFWDPGPNQLSVTAEDRAGNGCQADLFLMYGTP